MSIKNPVYSRRIDGVFLRFSRLDIIKSENFRRFRLRKENVLKAVEDIVFLSPTTFSYQGENAFATRISYHIQQCENSEF